MNREAWVGHRTEKKDGQVRGTDEERGNQGGRGTEVKRGGKSCV